MPIAHEDLCRQVLPLWADRGYDLLLLQDKYRFSVDYLGQRSTVFYREGPYAGWPACVNFLTAEAVNRGYDLIVAAGDDMEPTPHLSAEQVASRYFDRFPDGRGVMQPVGDTWCDSMGKVSMRICGSPIFGLWWATKAYGGTGPLCSEYKNYFADEELLAVTFSAGLIWQDDQTSHEHLHWSRLGKPKPETAVVTQEWWSADEATFCRRRISGWPGALPPVV